MLVLLVFIGVTKQEGFEDSIVTKRVKKFTKHAENTLDKIAVGSIFDKVKYRKFFNNKKSGLKNPLCLIYVTFNLA